MSGWRDLTDVARKPQRLALGLMSGMSRDGVDLALVDIEGLGDARRKVDLRAAVTRDYPPALRERLLRLPDVAAREVAALDFDLAVFWSHAIREMLATLSLSPSEIDFIGSHGQTVYHRQRREDEPAITLQVGHGAVLAERTGILTVSDFRPRDIAAGGEGAPLIPLADYLLFARPEETVACHNLGSIANVTVCPPTSSADPQSNILAFDTGPANALIDAFARDLGAPFDRDGTLSARGQVDDDLLLALYAKCASWFRQGPPKSVGFETFGDALADALRAELPGVDPHDRVRTAVEFTAQALRDAYEWHVLPAFPDLVGIRLSGGGCRNPTLMARIRDRFADLSIAVEPLAGHWIDAKEAVGFALLADETLQGRPGNVPSATGARGGRILGAVNPP